MGEANFFAYVALLLWAPISVVAFAVLRPPIACAVLVLGAILLLPVGLGFDLPAVPPMEKEELASLFILVGGIVRFRRRLLTARPGRGLEALVLVLVVGGFGTALTNRDPLTYGLVTLPPLRPYDAVSMGVRDLLSFAVPFFLGRAFFRTGRDLRDLFTVVVIAALAYSLLILVELRLSPQLHRWFYGYFQGGFYSTVRYGGYRPRVFMPNGLALALFVATATLMSSSLAQARNRRRQARSPTGLLPRLASLYLAVILVLCKSFAAIGYGLGGLGLTSFARPRTLMLGSLTLVCLVSAYPLMRATDTFPMETLLATVKVINEERWDSLEFRVRNEDQLLAKAEERPAFGWGGYRRARIFDERGKDRSVTDGFWIIMLGNRGLIGFLCTFGLMVIPVASAYRRLPRVRDPADRVLVAGLSLVVALHTLDLIPNGLFSCLPIFYAGVLTGVLPAVAAPARPRRRGRRAALSPQLRPGARSAEDAGESRARRAEDSNFL